VTGRLAEIADSFFRPAVNDLVPYEPGKPVEEVQRELGLNINVLEPGQSLGLYHRERAQEGFLVLAGECLLLVEGEERPLRTWDFVHCPGGTHHIIVGAGSGPSVVLAVGGRGGRKRIVYPVDRMALEHGVGAERETTKPQEAYASFPKFTRCRYRPGWLPE